MTGEQTARELLLMQHIAAVETELERERNRSDELRAEKRDLERRLAEARTHAEPDDAAR